MAVILTLSIHRRHLHQNDDAPPQLPLYDSACGPPVWLSTHSRNRTPNPITFFPLPTNGSGAIQIILTFTTCIRPPLFRSNRDLESCLLCHPSSIFSFFFLSSLPLELSATIETEEGYHILLAHDLYPLLAICLIFQGNPPGSRIRSLGRSMVRLQPFRQLVIHETCRPCHVIPCSRTSPHHIRLHEGHERSAGEAREYLL